MGCIGSGWVGEEGLQRLSLLVKRDRSYSNLPQCKLTKLIELDLPHDYFTFGSFLGFLNYFVRRTLITLFRHRCLSSVFTITFPPNILFFFDGCTYSVMRCDTVYSIRFN